MKPKGRLTRSFRTTVATASLGVLIASMTILPASALPVADIPDANFRGCLKRQLGTAGLPADLTPDNLAKLKLVACYAYGDGVIHNIAGADLLTGATILFLETTAVTDLTPISGLRGLEQFLIGSSEELDTAPIGNLTKLQGLVLRLPKLDDVSFVADLPALWGLELATDPATSLEPLTHLPKLTSLTLGTAYADISQMPRMSALTRLSVVVTGTSLRGLDLPPTLVTLQIDGAKLTTLDGLGGVASVRDVDIEAPVLITLDGAESLRGMTSLKVAGSSLTDLSALASTTQLAILTAPGADVTDLAPLSGLSYLSELRLPGNPVSDLGPLRGLSSLATLAIDDTRVTDLSPLTDVPLTSLTADGNGMDTLGPVGTLRHLTFAILRDNALDSIEGLRGAPLQFVNLDDNELQDVSPLALVTPTAEVHLRNNRVRDLSPLPDTVAYVATDQLVSYPDAIVGVPMDLGIRSITGEKLCPAFTPSASCASGAVTFRASGFYHARLSSGSGAGEPRFTLWFDQHAGPNRAFSRTYEPTVSGGPYVGFSVQPRFKQWAPKPDHYTYQWSRDGKLIPGEGAHEFNYEAVVADLGHRLSVCVTGHLDGYEPATRCSPRSAKVGKGEIFNSPKPKLKGTAATDSVLSVVASGWDHDATLHYQWQRNHKNIAGATRGVYTVKASDVGDSIRVRVTGTKPGCSSHIEYSKSVTVRKAVLVPVVPVVAGEGKVGKVLTAMPGAWSPAPVRIGYQWYRGGKSVRKATKASYLLGRADLGKKITVKVTATKTGYTASYRYSVPTALIA